MEKMPVKTATVSDRDRAVAAVVLGFAADPVARWSYPAPHDYLMWFPRIVSLLGGRAFEHGTAYYIDNFRGAALWLPPEVEPEAEEMMALLERTVGEQRLEELFSLLEQMGNFHPAEPHWYLPLIGVDPTQQGNGRGSALMAHALIRCDREQRLAYLESTNPRNVRLYQRHGFEVLGTIQGGSFPPVTPMLRKPRAP
jgi:ribosomal protein S18 acetylase RimI-like enzyme